MTRGDVKCWGSNQFGILGDDTLANSTVPIEFNGF